MDKLFVQQLMNGTTMKSIVEEYCAGSYKKAGELLKSHFDEGFNINSEVYDNGEMNYYLAAGINREHEIKVTGNEVRTLIISDLHIGQINDGSMYLSRIYNYAKGHNIHIIFMVGDLFQGVYPEDQNKYTILERQVNGFLNRYPFDSSIVNYMLLGNHDLITQQAIGFDYNKLINCRPDIINLGYGLGKIKLGNDLLAFSHDLVIVQQPERDYNVKYIFKGHSHKFEIVGNVITVPALLRSNFYDDITSVGFLEADFYLDEKQNINLCKLKHFDLGLDTKPINEIYVSDKNIKIKKKI